MSEQNLVDYLRGSVDGILGVRDSLGAGLKEVAFVTRTWSGEVPGDGTAVDTETVLSPSPHIVDYSHSLRAQEGGFIKQGDLLIKAVSKTHVTEDIAYGRSTARNVEKFVRMGDLLYQVISVREKLLTWNIQVRKCSAQERFNG